MIDLLRKSLMVRGLWIATLIFCIALITNLIPALRGGFGWVWPYELPRALWIVPCVVGVGLYCVGTYALLKDGSRRLSLWVFVWSALLPILLLTLQGSPLYLLFTRTASTLTGGYQYASTMVTDLRQTLAHWPQFVTSYRDQTHMLSGVALDPPGLLAAFYDAERLLDRVPFVADTFAGLLRPLQCQNLLMNTWTNSQYAVAWFEMSMPLWAALTIVPLQRFGRRVFSERTTRLALAFWPLIPGMALFTPRFNTVYPLLTLVTLLFLWRGLEKQRAWPIVLAGFVVSVGTFLNFSLVPLGLLGGVLIIAYDNLWLRPALRSVQARLLLTVRQLILFGVGSSTVWIIYGALSGVTVADIIGLSLSAHLTLDRPYLPWLFLHPYDMFLFVGLPLALLSIRRMLAVRYLSGKGDVFALAMAVTLIALVLSGTARGETGRVWLFFAPCWLLLAANWMICWKAEDAVTFEAVGLLQAVCLLSMAAVLRVGFTALTVPPDPPLAATPTYPINAQFVNGSDRFTLAGLSVDQQSGTITLHLYWRADDFVRRPYVFSLVSVPPDHSARESLNWAPLNWEYPPACWTPGRPFIDTLTIQTDHIVGDWLFSVSASDAFSKDRALANDQPQVGIGPVHVEQ